LHHGPGKCSLAYAFRQNFPTIGSKPFGIVQTYDAAFGIENNRGGENRTKKRAPARFVQSCNALPAILTRSALKA
jgi:hypothetical protein